MYFMLQKLQLPEVHSNQSTFFLCCFLYISNPPGVIIMPLSTPTLLDKFTGYIDLLNVPLCLFHKQVPFQKTSSVLFSFLCRMLISFFSDNLTHFFMFELNYLF